MDTGFISTNTIIYCRDWDGTVRFYRDGLGLPVLYANDWFVELELAAGSRLSIADERRATIKTSGEAGITLALQVRDIEAAHRHAAKAGLGPTQITDHPWQARVFHLFDPEGHRVEMWQPIAPPVSASREGATESSRADSDPPAPLHQL
jgi:catechol 2,3-dioxygenase-like lactoylglutathione lyase family enzyme